jgi:hypothetical protein
MQTSFSEIEKSIPIPRKVRTGPKKYGEKFLNMQIDSCIFFKTKREADSFTSTIYAIFGKGKLKRRRVKKIINNREIEGFRIWRIA